MNAKRAWSEVRIGLGETFGLVGHLRHRNRRRPRHGHRAVHQGQRRPSPGCNEVRQIRTCTRFLSPHPPRCLGMRALLCQRGETARARNCGKTSLSYRPCRRLGRGGPKCCAPRVWQWARAAPCAAGPSTRAELPIYAKRRGRPAWAQGWGWAAGAPVHEKTPPAVRPASLGSKARRPCMRGEPNPATWETWDVRASACGGNLPVGPRLSAVALPQCRNELKQLLFPDLCASRGAPLPRLPSPCGRVYSSPSRRTPVSAAARTPRTGYCGRRRRSDRPFRTGFIRWLEEEEILPQAPVFHEFLESIYFFQL